jgi:hypothetical protein
VQDAPYFKVILRRDTKRRVPRRYTRRATDAAEWIHDLGIFFDIALQRHQRLAGLHAYFKED